MYKESKTYLTAAVTALVVAILFSLTAIFVRSVVAIDGKNTAGAVRNAVGIRCGAFSG